jgi:hypothetical protein
MAEKPESGIAARPEIHTMESLLDEVAAGRLRVPRYQRPFVWRPEQMRDLLDSIERGYPIGSLLIWETSERIPSLPQVAGLDVPPPPSGQAVAYVLDGHQRLSTLFGCLRRRPAYAGAETEEEWRWHIYRVLGEARAGADRFQHGRRPGEGGLPPPHHMPMHAVLRTMDFLAYCRRLESEVTDAARLIEEAEGLAQQLKSCQLAVVRLQGGGLGHAVQVFSRLNTTGLKMTPDQMVSALIYDPDRASLADRIATIREGLGAVNYGQIDPITVFRTFLAIHGETDVQVTRWEGLATRIREGDREADVVEDTGAALERAVQFLRTRLGVPMARLVPYQPQLMLLAVFLHLCPEPNQRQVRELERWFWGTSWSGHFAGANSTDVKSALQLMKDFAVRERTTPWPPQSARPFPDRFDLRSARVRTFVLWELREFPERVTPDGTTVDPVEVLARSDTEAYRHVLTRNVEGLSHPANRLILPTAPRVSVRRALLGLSGDLRERVLESHGIPVSAMERLRADDGDGFIAERARELIGRERRFMEQMGIKPAEKETGAAEVDTE